MERLRSEAAQKDSILNQPLDRQDESRKCCSFEGRSVKKFCKRNAIGLPVLILSTAAFAAMLAVGQVKGIRALSIAAIAPGLIGLSAAAFIAKNERNHKHRHSEYETLSVRRS